MQDPLIHLTPEQPIDLSTLFGPASDVPGGGTSGDEGSLGESNADSATLESEEAEEIEEIVEQNKEELEPESTLEERIKKVEEEYNEKPIPIYGATRKRLVTLAKSLTKENLLQQASSVCDILDGE